MLVVRRVGLSLAQNTLQCSLNPAAQVAPLRTLAAERRLAIFSTWLPLYKIPDKRHLAMSCENCVKGYELSGEPKGQMVDGAYFAPAPEGQTSTRAVVLLTDIFGLPLVNCKIMADNLAARLGCDVWVPDLFEGHPPVAADRLEPLMPDRAGVTIPFWNKLRLVWFLLNHIFVIMRNRPAIGATRVTPFIEKLRKDKTYQKIGAVGYCYGGAVAVLLGATSLLESIVICHPGNLTVEQIKAIKVPASWACAEDDMSFKAALRNEAEATFVARKDTDNKVDYEFKDYKGTAHGFAARPNLSIPEVKAGFEGAFDQTVEWFKKTIPA